MCVKVGGVTSGLRKLSGGSPQWSILGCSLYCNTTQQINLSLATRRLDVSLPAQEDMNGSNRLESSMSSTSTVEDGFQLMTTALTGDPSPSSSSEDSSFRTADSPSLDPEWDGCWKGS